jgi:hypothetical protein
MTLEQIKWASQQFWFEYSGKDADGAFVVGRDSYGSRPALVFHDFEKLAAWSIQQRNL